jgi:MSHA pilin protein MshD
MRLVGFTLIEMIVFITIVSIALAGTLSVFSYTARVSADPVQPKQAMLVAESMLEEIELKPYNNPPGGYAAACPGTCNRALFDNVGDYAGYTTNGVYSLDDLTTPVPGLTNYTVSVAVTPVTVSATGNALAAQRITVTVTVGNVAYTLSGYRFDND